MAADHFSERLLNWFDKHGRHDLPWQLNRTPYSVWVSEIMLQQTQVVTVIPYFERFIKQFSNVKTLATASLDEVLHHWTGLGYYARARNMHKTANIIVDQYNGQLPDNINELISLPGIGRSTAGAILSLACGQRHPILDGNVKRVLSRYHAIEGWPGKKAVETVLWSFAEQHTPVKSVDNYTQAIMDLGATICTRRIPNCDLCPLKKKCLARETARQHDYPGSKPKTKPSRRETVFAMIENKQGEFLLEKRPPSGIWGGLWCFPEISINESIANSLQKQYGYKVKEQIEHKSFKHTFSHFQLMIKPVHVRIEEQRNNVAEPGLSMWLNLESDSDLGFPAPVVAMLKDLSNSKRNR